MEGRERMARYNGKGPDYCKNCGGDEGIHRGDDLACPANGVDQTGRSNPRYIEGSIFEAQDWEEDIKNGAVKDGKTLFDEYFMAILPAIAQTYLTYTADNPDDLINSSISTAFLLAIEAMKKRNEYMKTSFDKAVGK
jgi:hypothetical protein